VLYLILLIYFSDFTNSNFYAGLKKETNKNYDKPFMKTIITKVEKKNSFKSTTSLGKDKLEIKETSFKVFK